MALLVLEQVTEKDCATGLLSAGAADETVVATAWLWSYYRAPGIAIRWPFVRGPVRETVDWLACCTVLSGLTLDRGQLFEAAPRALGTADRTRLCQSGCETPASQFDRCAREDCLGSRWS